MTAEMFFLMLSTFLLTIVVVSCSSGDSPSSGSDGTGDEKDDDDDDGDDDTDDDDENDDDTSYCDDPELQNEVWTDPATGLTWQVVHSCNAAPCCSDYCNNREDGGLKNWRMPTISELRTLVRGCPGTETGGECGVTDECLEPSCNNDFCLGCEFEAGPNNGCYGPPELRGECWGYWSSSEGNDSFTGNWYLSFAVGGITSQWGEKGDPGPYNFVRCVHDPV